MRKVEFYVSSEPQAKGSMTAFLVGWPARTWSYIKKQAALIKLSESIKNGKYPQISLTSTNKNLKKWEKKVKEKAESAMAAEPGMLEGAIRVSITFFMKRPKTHFGTGKNAAIMKAWAIVAYHVKKPDLDKLLRAAIDPMTGTIFKDDSQVVEIAARKRFAKKRNGIVVTVTELDPMIDSDNDPFNEPVEQLMFNLNDD